MLDSQNGLVAAHEVSTGTLSASLVHPREVFGPALRVPGVARIVLMHNHPSGDPTPSRADLNLTRQLVDAGRLLDIKVHDQVVIGSGSDSYTSLAQKGVNDPPMVRLDRGSAGCLGAPEAPITRAGRRGGLLGDCPE